MNKNLLSAGVGLLFVTLGTVGCGDSEPDLYARLNNSESDAVATLCGCFEAVGAATEAECLAEFSNDDTALEAACVTEVYATYRTEAADAVACQVSVYQDAEDCVNAIVACNATAVEACFMAADTASEACPELPLAVDTAIDNCYN